MVVLDALRRDRLSLYGYERPTTPKLDARRPRLRVFTDAITQAPQTAPSIASVFTGVPPYVHGLQFNPLTQAFSSGAVPMLPASFVTMAERLHAAGYATFGIAANPWMGAEWGFGRGFDSFVGSKEVDPTLPSDGERILAHVGRWFETAPAAPRFVYAHFMDTHAPYVKGHAAFVTSSGTETIFNGRMTVAAADLKYMSDLYDSDVLYADSLVAQLLDRLDASGRPWVAAVIGDHGDEFGEHGGLGHGSTLYEELLQVPVVFTGSTIVDRHASSSYPLRLTDVHDILLAAAGLQPDPLFGLVSTRLPEPRSAPNRTITSEVLGAKALRQAEWKYIVTGQPFSEELYDLKRDPRERVNLVTRQQKISARLRREASALWPEMFTTHGDGARDIQSAVSGLSDTQKHQ